MRFSVRSLSVLDVTGFALALVSGFVVACVAALLAFTQSDIALAITPTPTVGPCQVTTDIADCFDPSICSEVSACIQCCNRLVGDDSCQARCESPAPTPPPPPPVGGTYRVSVSSDGTQAASWSRQNAITADGRYVAFSSASELAPGGTGYGGVFVRDRETGETTRASVDNLDNLGNRGGGAPTISDDGRYVAFESYYPGAQLDIFLHDRQTGQTIRVSEDSAGNQANGLSLGPSISADGRFVAFSSYASNLVPSDTNGTSDAFVYDRQTAQMTRASVNSGGVQGNGYGEVTDISADGRYVVFASEASNLVQGGDTNGNSDVFVHDRVTSQTMLVSVGISGNPGDGWSGGGTISADGRRVAFYSSAADLALGDTNSAWDVFVRDLETGQTTRVSVDSAGSQANDLSRNPAISGDGRYVAFESAASNLVSGDTNLCSPTPIHNCSDILVRDLQTNETTRESVDSAANQANRDSEIPAISADGRFVAFSSYASNLVPADTNKNEDVFVNDRAVPVGGIAEYPDERSPAASTGNSSAPNALAVAGVVGGAALLLAVGGWCARRRWLH